MSDTDRNIERLARRMVKFLREGSYAESGLTMRDIDQRQLDIGIEEEFEHTSDKELAMKIALDHLAEDPRYYTKLRKAGL